jgi:hypothetical protein
MSKQHRDQGEGAGDSDDVAPAPALGPGKRSGTAGAPSGPPPAYPGKRSLTQHFAPRPGRTPMPTVDDVATNAVENKGGGGGLDPGVRSTMEAHLGMDLGDVRVHEDAHAGASAKAMGARAFAHGKDIYLGPNEKPTDLTLMAHELTHVAQQSGGAVQPQRKVTVGAASSPAEQQADAVAQGVVGGEKPPMLVEPGAPVQAGQMSVAEFLAGLRTQVEAAAAAKFGPLWSVTGCHYIEKYFAHYQGRSAKEIERAMKLYAPEAAASGNAHVAIAGVTARVRTGMATWESTGELPADAAKIAPPEAGQDVAAANTPRETAQAMPHECTALCKHAPGEHPTNPLAALGEGAPLEGEVASRMGDALGSDVSMARVHTGPGAAELARDHGATAVTVGQDIAFGAGAYQPGTAVGDALLAHELAHTVQQKGADPTGPVGGESAAAEANADQVAAGAVAQLHAGASKEEAAAMALSQIMSTGLSLQRCSPDNNPTGPTVTPPSAKGGTKDLFDGAKAPDETQQQKIDKILNPTGAGGAASKPYKRAGFKSKMTAALDTWRKDTTAFNKRLTGPDSFKLDMPQVRKTGDAAQKVVTDKYGEFIKGSSGGANASHASDPGYKVGAPAVLHTQEESIDPLPKADQEQIVRGLVSYAMEQDDGGAPVTLDHNVDLTRSPDKDDYYGLMLDYAKKHHAELVQIQRNWPGEEHPADGTVYIQLKREKRPDLKAKESADPKSDANLRYGYWSTFQTLIHEYLHAAAHGKWREIENNANASQYHIMAEGTCEYFTERAYRAIEPNIPTDDALREQVEGKKYPWLPEVLPKWHGYDSRAKVEEIVAAMGGNEQNLRLAYFMGHVELVGLGKWKKEMAGEAGNYEVPIDDMFLSTISDRTFVSLAEIRKANGFPDTQDTVKKGRIVVPGISYHHAVKGDTQASIAAQHGITEDALAKANPLIRNWALLRDDEQVLIPVH